MSKKDKKEKENLQNEDLEQDKTNSEKVEDVVDPKDEEITKLKEEVAKLKNAYAMAYADTENLKKRLQSEAEIASKYRCQSFLTDILPVIDNFDRALESFENKDDNFYKGIKMIYDQLLESLKKEGVSEIECLDTIFNPSLQQAIMQEENDEKDDNTVLQVLQKGYMLKDRVLRVASVKVSKKKEGK